ARPGEPDECPQLVRVMRGREQVRRATDAHRREPRERLVARGLDPDPALDVGAGSDRVEGRDHAAAPRARRSISATSGNGWRAAAARTSAATASAAPGRPRARAAPDILAC